MIKLSPEAYKELFDEVHNILSCNGKFEVPSSAENTDEFWFGGIKYLKDENKVKKLVRSAPIVLDTSGGFYGKDVRLTVNDILIDGVRRVNWSACVTGMHELELVVLGVKTKGEV